MKKRNLSMIEYFNRRAEKLQPKYRFAGKTKADFETWHSDLFGQIKTLLGEMPEPVDLNPEIVWEIREDSLIKRRILLDTEADMSVAVIMHIPEKAMKKPAPAILCNHGHGTHAKNAVMNVPDAGDPTRAVEIAQHNYDYGLQMAKHGYVTIGMDLRVFGERSDGGNPYPGRDKCNVQFIRGALMGIYTLTLNIFDQTRLIDYLETLDFVDSKHIGVMGLSQGGTMTTWTALYDQRIKAADIICYSDRFAEFAVRRGNFCGSQFVPGLFALCDVPDLQGLIAPRSLLVEIGANDRCFEPESALNCAREVEKIYAAAGVPENFEIDLFNEGHQFAGNKAFGFFDKHLKKG